MLIPVTLYAQTPEMNAIRAASRMGGALVNKDFNKFVETTYPKVLTIIPGGKSGLIKDIRKQLANMAAQGTSIIKLWPEQPSKMIDTAGELQCTIPQNMLMKINGGTIKSTTTLIGLSPDKGSTWYFIDATDKNMTSIRSQFPNISSQLVIPTPPNPIFTADKKK